MGEVIRNFVGKFNEFQSLEPGKQFFVQATEEEATAAAREYLAENKEHVSRMIRSAAGVSLEVSDPNVRFRKDEVELSARGGKGFMKVKATLCAEIVWDGRPIVNVKSVDVPFVSVTPQKLNSVVEKPLLNVMEIVGSYAEIRSFSVRDGVVVLEALRK